MTKRLCGYKSQIWPLSNFGSFVSKGTKMIFDDKPTVISRPRVTMIEDSTLFQLFKIERGEAVPEKVSKMTLFAAMAVGFAITIASFVMWEYFYG